MEFRQLGHSGLKIPVLSFGAGTFGGRGEFFQAWGNSDVKEATRLGTSASKPESTSSTPPTCILKAYRKKSSTKQSPDAAAPF